MGCTKMLELVAGSISRQDDLSGVDLRSCKGSVSLSMTESHGKASIPGRTFDYIFRELKANT